MAIAFALLLVVCLVLAVAVWTLRQSSQRAAREAHIRNAMFPPTVWREFEKKHPTLLPKDQQLVARALRSFFLAHSASGGQKLGMPSRVVDDLWHAFILDTQRYMAFCGLAFGQYFHHVPASGMGQADAADQAMRRTWVRTCREENINPLKPLRLPLLFAIDDKLKVANGYHYDLNAEARRARENSDGGFACGSGGLIGDSGGDGAGDGGGGDGGCGGGGCGGGCGSD